MYTHEIRLYHKTFLLIPLNSSLYTRIPYSTQSKAYLMSQNIPPSESQLFISIETSLNTI
jgi:hypothetical protein